MKTSAPTRQPSFASLEQRIANQQRRITEGLRSGSLTKEEASPLQERLGAAKTGLEADRFDGNGLSQRDAAKTLLKGLSTDIKTAKHNDTIDADKSVANLERAIAAGKNDGTLTAPEAEAMTKKVADLKAKVAAATTPEAKQALTAEVKAMGKELRQERHDADFDATNRVASMNHRIEAGLKDGSLNMKEAARLTGKVAGLAALQAAGINSPKLFNQVSKAIFGQRHDANVDTARVAKGIEETLAKPASCLTPEQVAAFKERLAKLTASGAPAAGPQLNVLKAQIAAALLAGQPVPALPTATAA